MLCHGSENRLTPVQRWPARLVGWVLGGALIGTTALAGPAPDPSPLKGSAPAQGTHTVQFRVAEFGRYAVTVASAQGVALQLVDRAAGPLAVKGEAGQADGRFDGFLEPGEYRARLSGPEKADGEAQWEAHPFTERQATVPVLEPLRTERTELVDFEQRSYALQVTTPEVVWLEAAGRHLADLRLWRDGTWLVEANPEIGRSEPHPGQPIAWRRLQVRLEPGLYRVVAYGGPGEPWAEESSDRTLTLRLGIPPRGLAGRSSLRIGETGVDRWLVPGRADFFRLELPSTPIQREVRMQLSGYNPASPGPTNAVAATIDKHSRLPVAELDYNSGPPWTLVEVRGEAGQAYTLQHFEARDSYDLPTGRYWLSTLHAGDAMDRIDATALLVRRNLGRDEFIADRAVELGAGRGWSRRFNLLDPTSLFLHVSRGGTYRVSTEGGSARFRIEPFFTIPPAEFRHPDFVEAGHAWTLDPGYYVLDCVPGKGARGVIQVSLVPGAGRSQAGPMRPSVRFGEVSIGSGTYTLYLNRMPGTRHGVLLRELPVDLTQGLPVDLMPGEGVTIPVTIPEPGRVRALRGDGSPARFQVDGGDWVEAADLGRGPHAVVLRAGDAPGGEALELAFAPRRFDPDAPQPSLPRGPWTHEPEPPRLEAETPRFLDLGRHRSADFALEVTSPGLYRLETTGLLQTAERLATRVLPRLVEVQANGSGRNALIQQYLGSGAYRLTVTAQGDSAGHLGVRLTHAPLLDGGVLDLGNPARATIPAGQALAYRLQIPQSGDYRLHTLGLRGDFRLRLEDADGWPPIPPNQAGEQQVRLDAGAYRLIVLPQPVTARALTRIAAVTPPPRFEGHGPHALSLGSTVNHLWQEPHPGESRTPDQWDFALPAVGRVHIALDNDMRGELLPISPDGTAAPAGIAEVVAGRGYQGELPAGRYRLALTQRRPNQRVPYSLAVSTEELLPGQTRALVIPGSLTLSLGGDGLAEVYSVGGRDVQARLLDPEGRPIAVSDDRADDWNFHIARRLSPGRYRLEVAPVGAGGEEGDDETAGATEIHLRTPAETLEPVLRPEAVRPAEVEVQGDTVHLFPLEVPAGTNLLRLGVTADESMGMALERQAPGGWETVGQRLGPRVRLEVPLGQAGVPYRLRLWAVDHRHGRAKLGVEALAIPVAAEARLAAGVPAKVVDDGAVAAIRLEHPGAFRLIGATGEVRAGGSPAAALEPLDGDLVPVSGGVLWLATDDPRSAPFRAERLRLASGAEQALAVPGGGQVVVEGPPGDGPLLAIARTLDGQPGLRLLGLEANASIGIDAAPRVAVVAAASPGSAAAIELRNAGDADAPLRAKLQAVRFTAPTSRPLSAGVTQGELARGEAQCLTLPAGPKQGVLTLPPATAAVLLRGDRVLSTQWSGEEGATESLATEADTLLLLPVAAAATTATTGFRLELVPGTGAPSEALAPGDLWRRIAPVAGVARLRVAAAGPLHTLGAGQALFLADDGRVRQGGDLEATGPGALILRHGPGVLVAWAEATRTRPARTRGQVRRPEALRPPAGIGLAGRERLLSYAPPSPALLHLRSDSPMLVRWRQGGEDRVAAQPLGVRLDLYAPAEGLQITLYPLGETLTGQLQVTATPVEPVGEGMGVERLLPPGGTAAFGFTLDRSRTLGIGVHASADDLRATLLDAHGQRLGEGIAYYRELAPGAYVLLAHAPADAAPVRIAPVVLGLVPGDAGPPPEMIRRFIEAGEGAGTISDPPGPPPGQRYQGTDEATGEEGAEGETEGGEE